MAANDIVQGDFVRYVHELQQRYRLDIVGTVKGMEHYYMMAEKAREEQLARLAVEKENRGRVGAKVKFIFSYSYLFIFFK